MTPRIPTDDDLHGIIRRCADDSAASLLALAELERRAAASEGFAAGDVVTFCGVEGFEVVDPHFAQVRAAGGDILFAPHWELDRVPPAPTAIEVFESKFGGWSEDVVDDALAAFREFCRVATEAGVNIAADEPLGVTK